MRRNATQRDILFIGHTARRHGAPIALLHFLRWYRKFGSRRFSILLDEGGELINEYREAGAVWAADSSHWCPGGIRYQVLTAVGAKGWAMAAERRDVLRFADRCSPCLLYFNSVARDTARLLEFFDPSIPVLVHVHELSYLLRLQGGTPMFARAARFIACSNAVRRNLIDNNGISSDRIDTVHEAIPVDHIKPNCTRDDILCSLGFRSDCLLVAACGIANWNKGVDLFLQVALMVCRRRRDACFVWVGDVLQTDREQFEHDLHRLRISDRVRFAGAVSDSSSYFAASDLFVLTSREDSFPLVCLEAAALGKPIVCFAEAGGMPEFVESDCGFSVPYLDAAAMSERILMLLDSPACRRKMGDAARVKVDERHDISVAAPRIMDVIERTIAGG